MAGFGEDGSLSAGLTARVADYTGSVKAGMPVTLTVNVMDPSERDSTDPRFSEPLPIGVHFSKYRGPGGVEFTRHESTPEPEERELPAGVPARFRRPPPGPDQVSVEGGVGVANVIATFSEAGEYMIHIKVENFRAPDSSNGDQCCWTNMIQRVTVSP